MNILSKFFRKKKSQSDEVENYSDNDSEEIGISSQIRTVPLSSINSSVIPEGASILYESEIPAFCEMGNLIFEKKYEEAIELGHDLLKETPNDPGVHINLMVAYFKCRDTNPDYFDKSTEHAKLAMLCGHHTGMAEDRLAKNLDKCKLFHQSLQLYNLILDNPDFHFSIHGMGHGIDFNKRREAVLKKMDKAVDSDSDVLFSPDEIAQIIQSIRDNDATEIAQRRAYEERIEALRKQADKALRNLYED